jgi:hypothetical protein
VLLAGDELKLVYPQADAPPERFAGLAFHDSSCSRWTAPTTPNLAATVEYCLRHPQWRLSLQTHKIVGIPDILRSSDPAPRHDLFHSPPLLTFSQPQRNQRSSANASHKAQPSISAR